MKPAVEFQNISKSFFGIDALTQVGFSVDRGRTLGLIGENGAGKSTLMNLLGGILFPDEGEIYIHGAKYAPKNPVDAADVGIAFIHQELNLFTNLTIADNLFITRYPKKRLVPLIKNKEIEEKTARVLSALKLQLSPNDLVEKLQPGERQMVEVAKALSAGADVLIFDEPTTSLTSRETEHLYDVIRSLKKEGKTIIYISHILEEVCDLCDDVVVLRDGSLVDSGPVEEFDINRMIASMCGCELDQLFPARQAKPSRDKCLQLEKISSPGIVKDISFSLFKGEVLGLFGLMGSGRSELARLIFGLDTFESGTITIDDKSNDSVTIQQNIQNKMAFISENRREEGLMMEASIRDNMMLVALNNFTGPFKIINRNKNSRINESLKSLKIKSNSLSNPVKTLSGGNQQKVVIGKWLLSHPSVFIMDEPTRGIDVGAKYEVYSIINSLAATGTGILFISSELEELMGMCDRILVMHNGEISREFIKKKFDNHGILRSAFGELEVN